MTAANTRGCFRALVGRKVTGVIFNAFSANEHASAALILDDGRALVVLDNGSYWLEAPAEVKRAVDRRVEELRQVETELAEAVAAMGAAPPDGPSWEIVARDGRVSVESSRGRIECDSLLEAERTADALKGLGSGPPSGREK